MNKHQAARQAILSLFSLATHAEHPCALRCSGVPCFCSESMKTIQLTKGFVAVIDDQDFDWLNRWKWHASFNGGLPYAKSQRNNRRISMHRLITGATSDQIVDHKNRDSLDNRRCNLRIVTSSQNMANRRKNSRSKYKGIWFDRQRRRWRAAIEFNGKRYSLGRFKEPVQAALAYDQAARKIHGSFACVNFAA